MRPRTLSAFAALTLGTASFASAQGNFNVYVALGDSLTAGFESGSLVVTHQQYSYPAQIAGAAGVTGFQQPTVSEPGIPVELALVSLTPEPVVEPKASTPGSPTNLLLPRPYNNLGVPGAVTYNLLTTVTDGGGFFDLILRKQGTALQQAGALRPSFITLWIGNNDALAAVVAGEAIEGVTLTPVQKFASQYSAVISVLKQMNAPIVVANIPDVTTLPFVTTIPPVVVNPVTQEPVLVNGLPVPLIGPNGSLPSNAYVLLPAASLLAQGIGIPKAAGGTGTPLPDQVILDANKVGAIQDHVNGFNAAISQICAQANVPIVDVNSILKGIAAQGMDVGGIHLTAQYLSGGLFSYDGIHPTDLGYAIIANNWIQTINSTQGTNLPLVNLGKFLGVSQASATARSTGPIEFSDAAYQNLLLAFPPVNER